MPVKDSTTHSSSETKPPRLRKTQFGMKSKTFHLIPSIQPDTYEAEKKEVALVDARDAKTGATEQEG